MQFMKLYVSHARKSDYEAELYEPLRKAFGAHEIFFPHEVANVNVKAKDVIAKADYVIAEVSFPSTGQGIELGWADSQGVPIICVYKTGSEISGALRFVADVFIEYATADELLEKLKTQFEPSS